MIMETEKSYHPPSASWRPRKASGVVLRPGSQRAKSVDFGPSLSTRSAEGQERMDVPTQAEWECHLPPPFCSTMALKGLDDACPLWEGHLPVQMLITSGNTFTDTPRNNV